MHRSFELTATLAALSIATLGASAFLAGTAGATTLPTFNAPGIPKDGYPDFMNNNDIGLVFGKIGGNVHEIGGWSAPSGDYVLAAAGTYGVFNYSSTSGVAVNDELFGMYAEFNSKGQFLSGGETIYGCQPPGTSCSIFNAKNLYTVSFDKYAVSTSTVGLGFDTVSSTASGWAKQFQKQNESLYLYSSALASLDNALASGKNLPSFFSATVSEITTVPIPAAGWLLGCACAALFSGLRRRRCDAGSVIG
jgi:hypothetical protein